MMIDNYLLNVEKMLYSPSFFDFLKKIDIDSVLDSRDYKTFDYEWMANFKRLENDTFSKGDLDFIDKLREKSFNLSFMVVNDAEISSRISDDIEIIAKDILNRNDSGWPVRYLWQSYKNGVFPC